MRDAFVTVCNENDIPKIVRHDVMRKVERIVSYPAFNVAHALLWIAGIEARNVCDCAKVLTSDHGCFTEAL